MGNKLIIAKKLETLLQTNWAEFLDRSQFIRIVLELARDSEFKEIRQEAIPPRSTRVSITKFAIAGDKFEVWAEFTVPKGEGVVVGTHVISLSLSGEFELKETYGTHFLSENS